MATWRQLVGAVAFVAAVGCQGSHPLDGTGGASKAPDGAATTDRGVEAGGCPKSGADLPCGVDADCESPYLICAPPDKTITICRDPAQPVEEPDPACPAPFDLTNVPVCPEVAPFLSNVCNIRYQRPCKVASDCGPDGFKCDAGACRATNPGTPCTSASECPTGWECYASCPCPGVERSKVCEPPFAVFHCPSCMPIPG